MFREFYMGLLILILGLIVFVAAHSFVTFRAVRADAIERLGLMTYRALFALVSLIGLAIIIYGYRQYHAHELIQVWSPPAFMRHITEGLMLFAVIFFLSLIHISEPTRLGMISYAVFCLKKK